MYNRKEAVSMVEYMTYANIINGEGLNNVPNLVSIHGEGKTSMMHQISHRIMVDSVTGMAKKFNWKVMVFDVGLLSQGEVGGIPHNTVDPITGKPSFEYVKHFNFNEVKKMEDAYIEKLYSVGFLDGKLKGEGNKLKYEDNVIFEQEDTFLLTEFEIAKKVFNSIPKDLRLQLIKSGEVKGAINFFDEINRADPIVRKEVMNVILAKKVQDYDIPWFATFVSAMNPDSTMSASNDDYQTDAFDKAQIDRFVYIPYALSDEEFFEFLTTDDEVGSEELIALSLLGNSAKINTTSSLELLDENINKNASRRSWHIALRLISGNLKTLQSNKELFSDDKIRTDETGNVLKDVAFNLFKCKLGTKNGVMFEKMLENAEKMISVDDICKSTAISKEVMAKFNASSNLTKKLVCSAVLDKIVDSENSKILKEVSSNPAKCFDFKTRKFNKECLPMPLRQYCINLGTLLDNVEASVRTAIESRPEITQYMALLGMLLSEADLAKKKLELNNLLTD